MHRLPLPPLGFNPETFFQDVYWFQRWEVFPGIFTPGINPIREILDRFELPPDLTGKRVLDLGPWNGCMSFECERRNAAEIIALGPEDPDLCGFNRLARLLHSTRTRYVRGTCYDLDPRKLGFFDIVLFCGVLYHLRYPLLAIDNIRRVAADQVYVETVLMDERPESSHPCLRDLKQVPVWIFFRGKELEGDNTNWFGPNETAVRQAFESAGFETLPARTHARRGQIRATVKPGTPEFISHETLEGIFYPQLLDPLMGRHRWRTRAERFISYVLPFTKRGLLARLRQGLRYRLVGTLARKDFVSPGWQTQRRNSGLAKLPALSSGNTETAGSEPK